MGSTMEISLAPSSYVSLICQALQEETCSCMWGCRQTVWNCSAWTSQQFMCQLSLSCCRPVSRDRYLLSLSWADSFFPPHSPSLELRPGLSPSLGLWTNVVTNKDFVLDIDTYICQCRLGHVQCTLICELKGAHWKSGKKAETFNPLLRYR